MIESASAADVALRREIDRMHDAAEARLTAVRPRMIAVGGGEPMVWTEHDDEQEGATGGRIQ